jgi:protein-S-isoprenylcysteine O-methyltransferase Ste14
MWSAASNGKIEVYTACIQRKDKTMPTSFWGWIYFGGIFLCWATFFIVWCVGAIYNAFKAPATHKRSGGLFSWGLTTILVLGAVFLPPRSIWQFLTFDLFWLRLLGLILLLASTAFTLWARYVLGLMWTSAPIIKSEHILHTDGPYRITRHPIYTGLLGMLIGSLLIGRGGQWFLVVVVALFIFEVKIMMEERLLLATFGEQYVQFKARVPQLIPFTKWKHS